MMITLLALLVVVALATAVASIMGKCPLWVPVIVLCVIEAVQILP